MIKHKAVSMNLFYYCGAKTHFIPVYAGPYFNQVIFSLHAIARTVKESCAKT